MASDSEVIEEYEAFITATYIAYAILTLVVYEYVITLRHEVGMMWQMKHTGATWLFILNRYLMLANITVQCLPVYSQRGCGVTLRLVEAITMAQYLVFALFSALRVYALWSLSVPIFIVIFCLNLVPIGSDLFNYIRATIIFEMIPGVGPVCTDSLSTSSTAQFRLVLATRFCMIIADVIVLALTWVKTYRNSREFLRMNMGVSLSILLLRDGTVYFVVLLAMNIAQICVENVPRLQVLSPVITFINNLTPILTSRFLINLRQVEQLKDELDGAGFSRFTIPGFRAPTSITGNIGECLEFDGWETPEQTTEEPDSVALHLELTNLSTPLDVQIT